MIKLDAQDIRMVEARIKEYNGERNLINRILKELDATLVLPDGGRPRQTISYVWKHTDAVFHYLLNKLMDDGLDNDEYNAIMLEYKEVLANNAKYEQENPPVVYSKKKKSTTTKSKKQVTTTDMFTGEKSVMTKSGGLKIKKETVAERKARLFNEKAAKFTFSFNPPKK